MSQSDESDSTPESQDTQTQLPESKLTLDLLSRLAQAGQKVPFFFEYIPTVPGPLSLEEWKSGVVNPKASEVIEKISTLPTTQLDKRVRVPEICDTAARHYPALRGTPSKTAEGVAQQENDEDEPVIEFCLCIVHLTSSQASELSPVSSSSVSLAPQLPPQSQPSQASSSHDNPFLLLPPPPVELANRVSSSAIQMVESILATRSALTTNVVQRSGITDEDDTAEKQFERDDFAEIAAMGLTAERNSATEVQSMMEVASATTTTTVPTALPMSSTGSSQSTEEVPKVQFTTFYRDNQVRDWSPILTTTPDVRLVWVKCWSQATDVEYARQMAALPDFFATLAKNGDEEEVSEAAKLKP